MRPLLSVLIPAYNEAATIAAVLDAVRQALPGVSKEIIIVDDGSRDGTRELLRAAYGAVSEDDVARPGADALPGCRVGADAVVKVIFHDRNKGKGGAIQTALAACTGEVMVIQDADLEYDPADWARMYPLIADRKVADVVYGSRFRGYTHRSQRYHHRMANRVISALFSLLYDQALTDVETCYKMFTREVQQSLRLSARDFGIELQFSAQVALARRWRIYEVGIHYYGRTHEDGKKITWKDGLRALWYLARYRVRPYP